MYVWGQKVRAHECAFVKIYVCEYWPILPLVSLLHVLFYCPLEDVSRKTGETGVVEPSWEPALTDFLHTSAKSLQGIVEQRICGLFSSCQTPRPRVGGGWKEGELSLHLQGGVEGQVIWGKYH